MEALDSMMSIDDAKRQMNGKLKFRLRNANVYESPEGFHFIDYLDKTESIDPNITCDTIADDEVQYIERSLQSSFERFRNQVDLVKRFTPQNRLNELKLLDVGAGGGLFLNLAQREKAEVLGIELSDSRAFYASSKYSLRIAKRPLEDKEYWRGMADTFDIVTFWDVIEHVNFPQETINASAKLLKNGGLVFIDTPYRESFYHRFGEFTYALSGGKVPTFLNIMYSAHPFGHKQIFSVRELKDALRSGGFEVLHVEKFHELSFPIRYYLNKLLLSDILARAAEPLVHAFFSMFQIRNKMVVVARKLAVSDDLDQGWK